MKDDEDCVGGKRGREIDLGLDFVGRVEGVEVGLKVPNELKTVRVKVCQYRRMEVRPLSYFLDHHEESQEQTKVLLINAEQNSPFIFPNFFLRGSISLSFPLSFLSLLTPFSSPSKSSSAEF